MVSTLGFWLPTQFLEAQGPAAVRKLALELAPPLPFCSGHVGLSFHAMHGYAETEEMLSQLCLRSPGMDVVLLRALLEVRNACQRACLAHLPWTALLSELDGVEGLRTRLVPSSTTIQPLEEKQAIVTLGPSPEAGDTETGHHLLEYREFAHVLGQHQYRPAKPWFPYFPEDIWKRWDHRFLDSSA